MKGIITEAAQVGDATAVRGPLFGAARHMIDTMKPI